MQPGSDMLLLLDRPKKTSYEAIIEGDANAGTSNSVNTLNKKVVNGAISNSGGLEKTIGEQYQATNTAVDDLSVAQQADSKNSSNNSLDLKGNNNNTPKLPQVPSSESGLDFIIEKRDIILENDINNQQYCMPSIEVKFLRNEGSLFFSDLIERLKNMNFPLHNCMLFCWDEKRGMHVFVANDPIPQSHFLPAHLCGIANSIYIKFRSYQQQAISQPAQRVTSYSQQGYSQSNTNNSVNKQINNNSTPNNNNNILNTSIQSNQSQMIKEEDLMLSEENINNSMQGDFSGRRNKKMSLLMGGGGNSSSNLIRGGNNNNNNNINNSNNLSDKRVKERYIEKVREKVSEWRAMHETGFRDKDGNIQKLNLDHAANYIGISRKTLDDYYLQLRRAEQLGFDFDRNKSEKMGALRKFVKEESKKQGKKGMIINEGNNNMEFIRQIGNNNNNESNAMIMSQMEQGNISGGQHGYNNNNNNNNNLRPFGAMGESEDEIEQSSQDMLLQGSNNNNNLLHQLKNNPNNNFGGMQQYMNSIPSNSNSLANNNNNSSMASLIKSIHSSHNTNKHNNIGNILGGLGNMSSVSSSGSGGSVNLLSKNSIQSLIGQSSNNQNTLMGIGGQQQQQQSQYFQQSNHNNNNTATLLTPYNYNQNSQLNFNQQSGGPFYGNTSNHPMMGGSNYMQNGGNSSNNNNNNNNNQGTNSQVLLQAYQSRGSYMLPEGMDGSNLQNTSNPQMNLVGGSNNGNQQISRNSQNNPAAQLFNPGSSFISTIGHSSVFPGGSAVHNAEFNNNNNNQNQQQLGLSEIQVEQRFSNHFSLMQLGGTSQIVEERNSFNFLNSGLSQNNNNIINSNNIPENINNSRLSNPSVFQMTEDNNNNNSGSVTTATGIANQMLNNS